MADENKPVAPDQTIPGGATLKEDGKTWVDSEGRLLSGEQVAAVKELLSKQAETSAKAELEFQRQDALRRNMVVLQAADVKGTEAAVKHSVEAQKAAIAELPDATNPEAAAEEEAAPRRRNR